MQPPLTDEVNSQNRYRDIEIDFGQIPGVAIQVRNGQGHAKSNQTGE